MMVERQTHGLGSLAVNALHGMRVVVPDDPCAAPGSIGEFAVFFKLNHESKSTVFASSGKCGSRWFKRIAAKTFAAGVVYV
jgi:hypothetical protein